ncbi:MAG: VOC family protein, partial [Nitrososphaerales archaeon]
MKFLHTSITVKNMDTTIAFYTKHLGLKLLRRREIPENNAEVAFLTDEAHSTELELTYWRDKKSYEEGDQLDHLAF